MKIVDLVKRFSMPQGLSFQRVFDRCDRPRYGRERTVQSLGVKMSVQVMNRVVAVNVIHQVMTNNINSNAGLQTQL